MRILIVEDEPSMRMGLRDNLEFEGYQVFEAADGQEGLDKIRSLQLDLILLDVMMPKVSGFDVCKTLRKEGYQTPVIFLTAKGEEIDKVLGLELGADDYIQKPFSIRELLARIKAVSRRSSTSEKTEDPIQIGLLTVNFAAYEAFQGEQKVKMSSKEMEILAFLYKHANETVDRHQLLEQVWGYEESPTTRTVDNFVVKLRQKIEENPADPAYILTIHGIGYRLIIK